MLHHEMATPCSSGNRKSCERLMVATGRRKTYPEGVRKGQSFESDSFGKEHDFALYFSFFLCKSAELFCHSNVHKSLFEFLFIRRLFDWMDV